MVLRCCPERCKGTIDPDKSNVLFGKVEPPASAAYRNANRTFVIQESVVLARLATPPDIRSRVPIPPLLDPSFVTHDDVIRLRYRSGSTAAVIDETSSAPPKNSLIFLA